MAKFVLRILIFLSLIVLFIGLWGFSFDPVQGIVYTASGFILIILVAAILDLLDAKKSLKSNIYYHRKEIDDLRKLIHDKPAIDEK